MVVRLAGEAWFADGEVGRRRVVGELLASSNPAAAERGNRGESISEVRRFQIEQGLEQRGPARRDRRLPDAAELRSIPSTEAPWE